jgi:alpha-beta hydrolase superfamily lysophospholipase
VTATETEIRGHIQSADGTRLAYREWPRAKPSVIFAVVHGLGEHSGRYARFAIGMARHNMATAALDLRGHGESDGPRGHVDSWSKWVDDAAAFVAHVEDQAKSINTDTEVIPLGHSFGGVVMLSTVRAGRVPNAKRFVLSSPALKLKAKVPGWKVTLANVASRLTPRLALDNEVDPSSVSRLQEVVEAYRADPLVHPKISARTYAEWTRASRENLEHAHDIAIPFLILAGTADPLIDPAGSEELHRRAPRQSELHLLDGRYHEPFNDEGSDEVFDLIARWVKE